MSWKHLVAFIALLLSWHSFVIAQDAEPKPSPPHSPCGNPAVHSDFYLTTDEYENVTVTSVVNGNTVVVTLRNGKQKHVRLGGVDAPDIKTKGGQLSQRHLSGLVLNKRVNVWLHGSDFKDERVGGRISLNVSSDVNLSMLEAGMGRYGLIEHLVSYDKCLYQLAAKKAQEEKRGLWQEPAVP